MDNVKNMRVLARMYQPSRSYGPVSDRSEARYPEKVRKATERFCYGRIKRIPLDCSGATFPLVARCVRSRAQSKDTY